MWTTRNLWIAAFGIAGIVGAAAGASVGDSWALGAIGGFLVGLLLAGIAVVFGGFDLRL